MDSTAVRPRFRTGSSPDGQAVSPQFDEAAAFERTLESRIARAVSHDRRGGDRPYNHRPRLHQHFQMRVSDDLSSATTSAASFRSRVASRPLFARASASR